MTIIMAFKNLGSEGELFPQSVLDDEGRVDFGKMRPIVYDSTRRIYRVVGEEVGGAWDAGKALM